MKKFVLTSFAMLMLLSAWAQERSVSGKVTSSEDGSALPGVNVVLKGTTNGTTTDSDGAFTLMVPQSGGSLVFSFIGLRTSEVAIGDRTTLDVSLALDITQLSEVVVTGVGVATDKRKLGIAVEALTSRELPNTPSASIDQALVGKIAGAQISSTNGTPGADINILLRGVNTINRGTSPIILIDGVQISANLNSIDLSTIDRVEVVQGAAAATMYGAQGANGVIQLFTKKGKSGKINVDVSSSVSNNTYLNIGGLRKAKYHAFVTNANNEVVSTGGVPLTLDPETLVYSANVQYNPLSLTSSLDKPYDQNLQYYDHFNFFFKPANTYNNSVAISGGKDKMDFMLSASNNKQESNIIENGYVSRSNFLSNLGFEIAKGLSLRSITQLIYTKNTLKSRDRDIIYSVNNARPFADFAAVDTDGDIGAYFGDAVGVNHFNPLYYQRYSSTNDNKVDVIQNLNLNYKFPKFVEVDMKYGLNYQRQEQIYVNPNQSDNNNAVATESWISTYANDYYGEVDNFSYNKVFQNFLASAVFRFDFKNDFQSSLPLVSSTQVSYDYRNTNDREYVTYGLGLPTYTPSTSAQATTYRILRDQRTPFITYGYLVNQRLEYDDFLGVSAGFRSDYSSAFGGGSKPFTFPRGDAYVRISSMDFWETSSISGRISEFKLRGAYGEAGIQPRPFDRYPTLGTRALGNTVSFYNTATQSNPELDVEVSRELEIGTDLAFNVLSNSAWLNDIGLSMTYWKRSTDNAIYNVNAPPSSGIGLLKDNAFSLESRGLQASLNIAVLEGNKLTWNMVTNFGKQTSEISGTNGQEIVVLSSAGSTNYVLKAGEKIGQLYGYVAIHDVAAIAPDGNPYIAEAQQGDYEVASNGYVVSKLTKQPFFSARQYSFGDPNPKFNMSFINDFTYSNFLNFSFQIDWVEGSHLYNQTKEWMYRDGIHSDYEKPITINGETGAWTAFYRGVYAQRQANGTKNYFYEDASFMRLRNVSIGIDLEKVFKIPMRKLQLVAAGRNLWTATNYTGMDPEVSSGTTNSAFDRGTDHNTMPNYRSYQLSLNIGL